MPEFCNPFSVLKSDKKLTQEELVRAIRFMIAAEYEAIQLYQQTAESTDNKLAKKDMTVKMADGTGFNILIYHPNCLRICLQ